MRLLIAVFTLVAGMSLALPDVGAGAAGFRGKPGSLRASRVHRPHSFSRPFHRFGFVGVGGGGIDEQPVVIIIQQFQSAPPTQPGEPAQEKVYVQPRWVDGGHGVQVLEPGYWTAPKQH
ncbi:MAG: hypothetical protein WCH75_22660 [Candidatus Binatia bacterium]